MGENNINVNPGTFFAGGSGMFIEYQDIFKPIYLYALLKMIIRECAYGLPIDMFKKMSIVSIMEWYLGRDNQNPLISIDYLHKAPEEDLDKLMKKILEEDSTIYTLTPALNVCKIINAALHSYMLFPVIIYSPYDDKRILSDCRSHIIGEPLIEFTHGDVTKCIQETCDDNYTYIFSDIEKLTKSAQLLSGTCSNLLLAEDYAYSFKGGETKEKLIELQNSHKPIRIGLIKAMNEVDVINSFKDLVIERR